MKRIQILLLLLTTFSFFGCKKVIDTTSESYIDANLYYNNAGEMMVALIGCYNNMQKTNSVEWQLTELRSDNSKQGSPGSTASTNRDLSDLDMFTPSTSHQTIYTYMLSAYLNIRDCNTVLQKLGVSYDAASGTNVFTNVPVPASDAERRQIASEALFIRAFQYFNLVRLYGGVFIVTTPNTPEEAKNTNRSSVADCYKLIEADLTTAIANMNALKFSQIAPANVGRANIWAAKGMLAKVYLTQNKKSQAITLLQDVITNSGYSLLPVYANVFSITNEMNSEILFTIRYKAGGIGLGSHFANDFAPLGSGANVINGDGSGLNYPTNELDTLTNGDLRKPTLIGSFGSGTAIKLYVKKFFSPVVIAGDAENDWPVLRYADILLMLAEAQGYSQPSLDLINLTRARGGLPALTLSTISSVALFEKALSQERRVEFAFENQRWFDILRFNVTTTTLTSVQIMKDHFTNEFFNHYRLYVAPAPTLAQLYAQTTPEKMLLPIPQKDIDNNTTIVIPQNPGY